MIKYTTFVRGNMKIQWEPDKNQHRGLKQVICYGGCVFGSDVLNSLRTHNSTSSRTSYTGIGGGNRSSFAFFLGYLHRRMDSCERGRRTNKHSGRLEGGSNVRHGRGANHEWEHSQRAAVGVDLGWWCAMSNTDLTSWLNHAVYC